MTKMIKGRGYNIPNEVLIIFPFISFFCTPFFFLKVIRTFLSLQLNNVEEPVNQLGVASDTARINKEQKLKRKMEAKKMTRKQRRVRYILTGVHNNWDKAPLGSKIFVRVDYDYGFDHI